MSFPLCRTPHRPARQAFEVRLAMAACRRSVTVEERAFRKAVQRIIPFLFLIYVAYLDRVNVGVMEDSTGGFEGPLTALAGLVVFGALLRTFAREEPVSVPEPELSLAPD